MATRGKVLSILSLVLVGCGNQANVGKLNNGNAEGIMNGFEVTKTDSYSQHTVYIEAAMNGGSASCTGSILDSETILTAAHCIYGATQAAVVFAKNAQDPKTVNADHVRMVDLAAVYPKYQPEEEDSGGDDGKPKQGSQANTQPVQQKIPTLAEIEQILAASNTVDYDVAILHFKGGIPSDYSPVQLATSESVLQEGAVLHMIGYGLSRVNSQMKVVNGQPVFVAVPDHSTVGQLRETSAPIGQYNAQARAILTDSHQTGVCSGDSGGPAFVQDASGQTLQVGIAEAVFNRYCNSVSMHTAVYPYLDWIKQTADGLAKKSNPASAATQVAFQF